MRTPQVAATAGARVSVLIPAYRAVTWLGDAIESALVQTWRDLEVIVVDDGSDDGSASLLESFGERIRFETNPHRGANAARNRLLELARGEWLQYLDADDLLLPRKIEAQLAVAGVADLVVSPCLNDSGELRRAPAGDDPWACFLAARFGVTSSLLFRADTLRSVGGWDPTLRAGQEQALILALLSAGARVVFEPEPLCVKRHVNPDSLWRSIWRDDPKVARDADLAVVLGAVRRLHQCGELTPPRAAAAGARLLRIASGVWRRGAGGWLDVLEQAKALGLTTADLLSESDPVERLVHRAFGFAASRELEARRQQWRKRAERGRRRSGRSLRRLAGRARGAVRRLAGARHRKPSES